MRDNTPPAEDPTALPDATAPGDFVLHLVHSGPTPARTASLLSAVSGMPDALPAARRGGARRNARHLRRPEFGRRGVSAASGARFRAEPA